MWAYRAPKTMISGVRDLFLLPIRSGRLSTFWMRAELCLIRQGYRGWIAATIQSSPDFVLTRKPMLIAAEFGEKFILPATTLLPIDASKWGAK